MKFFKHNFYFAAAGILFSGCANLHGNDAVPAENKSAAVSAENKNAVSEEPAKAPEAKENAVPAPATVPAGAPHFPAARNNFEADPEIKALQEELEKISTEKMKLEAKISIARGELEKKLLSKRIETLEISTKNALRSAELEAEIAEIAREREEIERQFALKTIQLNDRVREKQLKIAELEIEKREQKLERDKLYLKYVVPAELADQKQWFKSIPSRPPKYLKEPLVDGTLYISDRRVDFNGPVTNESAAEAVRQINFFNNKSTKFPIFLVITNSPGGSVAAGYQIQQAMKSSKAPVYVVVKGFAASMAAVIATTAERSYCFANTAILHHQISRALPRKNLTILKETISVSEKWYEIFATPVAKKMGISLEEFTKQMYEHNSEGEWKEYGTEAQKLKWIDFVVDKIEETSVYSNVLQHRSLEQLDATTGERYIELPALSNPADCWWIFDKKGYFRAQ